MDVSWGQKNSVRQGMVEKCFFHLASVSFLRVKHVEQEAQFTGQTKLSLTHMAQ